MRKSVIIAIICILSFFFVPSMFSAESTDKDSSTEEYNELGIKKGTMVHGIDISELSEEELQYIPEDWRDGEFPSEHPDPETEDEHQIRLQSTYPNVNSYIKSQNLPEANVEYDHISHLTKFNYRYNRPEGVVAHETANNNSTITGEIAFMSRNHKNAFVHAFVDHSRVIETHPTHLGAWGAGPYANQRFIHVELVRVHSFDKFARSINNYANYIASQLYYYDLGVKDADYYKSGSLWSHRAVSYYLGGTTHVDPHGYFAKWGYSWSEFVNLVKSKYDNLGMKKYSTSKLGKVKSTSTPIYVNPENEDNYQKAGETNANQVFYIKQQGTLRGETYYLISTKPSSKSGTIGWVNRKDITVYSHTSVDRDKKLMYLTGSGVAYNRAWGGKDNIVYPKLSEMVGEILDVNLTEKVGNNIWYRGYLKGKQVWIHEGHMESLTDIAFNDVPVNSSHFNTIYEMVNLGAINGYPLKDGSYEFRPGNELSRSHAAVIFTEALNLPIPNDVADVLTNFKDVDSSHMYAKQIAATYQAGIFQGSDGNFMDTPLTREQMATVIAKAFDLQDTGVHSGMQLSNVSLSHRKNVELLAQHGITVLLDDFRSYENVTRGQFATFVTKAMNSGDK